MITETRTRNRTPNQELDERTMDALRGLKVPNTRQPEAHIRQNALEIAEADWPMPSEGLTCEMSYQTWGHLLQYLIKNGINRGAEDRFTNTEKSSTG